jgi:eukaryotic-like serine/threonine-protein kinase
MKLCLRCNQYFEDTEALCPRDKAPLEPVGKDPLIGALISDRYVVESVIGKGSSGIVYKARRMQRGEMVVAVKVLHSFLGAESGSLDRFLREARAASRLRNPHIITIWDSGVTDDGQPYFVMDYLEGITLAHLIREREFLHATRAFQIIRQICEALTEAHKQGIIHRDLKPENVVLQETDYGDDYVKLLDFGIAESPYDSLKQKLEKVKTVAGSPAYMSPEQCQGLDLDARSDIYSLAILTFEMLTGERPLQSDEHMSLMYMHVTSPPLTLADIRPEMNFPSKLEEVLARALSKKPAQRQASVKEYWNDLEASVKGTEFAELGPKPKKPESESESESLGVTGFTISESDRLVVEDDPKFGVKQTGWGFQEVQIGTVIKKSPQPAPRALESERVGFDAPKPMDFRPGASKSDALFIPPSTNAPLAQANETPKAVDPSLDWSLPSSLEPSLDWTKPAASAPPAPQAEAPNPAPQQRTPTLTPMWAQSLELPAVTLNPDAPSPFVPPSESLRPEEPLALPSEPTPEPASDQAQSVALKEEDDLDLDLELEEFDRIRNVAQTEAAGQVEPAPANLPPLWTPPAGLLIDPTSTPTPTPTQSQDPEPAPATLTPQASAPAGFFDLESVPAPLAEPTPAPAVSQEPEPLPASAPVTLPSPAPAPFFETEPAPAPFIPPPPAPTQSFHTDPVLAAPPPAPTQSFDTDPVLAAPPPAPTQSFNTDPVLAPPPPAPTQSFDTDPVLAPPPPAPTQSFDTDPVLAPPPPAPTQSFDSEPLPEPFVPPAPTPVHSFDSEPAATPIAPPVWSEPMAPLPVAASIAPPLPEVEEQPVPVFDIPGSSSSQIAAFAPTSVSDNGIAGSETPSHPALEEGLLQTSGIESKSGSNMEAFKNWARSQVPQASPSEQAPPAAPVPLAQATQAPVTQAPQGPPQQVGGVTKNGDDKRSVISTPAPLLRQKSRPSLIALGGGQKPVPNLAANLLAKIAAERGEPLPSKEEISEPAKEQVADQSSDRIQSVAQVHDIAQPAAWEADFSSSAPPSAPPPFESKTADEQISIGHTDVANFETIAARDVVEVQAPPAMAEFQAKATGEPADLTAHIPSQMAFGTPSFEARSEAPAPTTLPPTPSFEEESAPAFEIEMETPMLAPEPLVKEASPQLPVTATWQSILQDIAPQAPVKAREAEGKTAGAPPPLQLLAGKESPKGEAPREDAPPLDLLARLPRQVSPAKPVDQIRPERLSPTGASPVEPNQPDRIGADSEAVKEVPTTPTVPPRIAASTPPKVLESLGEAIGQAFENAFIPDAAATAAPAKPVKKEPPPQPELKPSVPVDYKSAIQAERKALLKTRQDNLAPQRAQEAASNGSETQPAPTALGSSVSAQSPVDNPPLGQLSARAEAAAASLEPAKAAPPSPVQPQEPSNPAPPLAALASISQTTISPEEVGVDKLLQDELKEDAKDDDEMNIINSLVAGGLVRHPTGIIPVYNEKAAQEAIAASKLPAKETPVPNVVKPPVVSPATTKVMSALDKEEIKNKATVPQDEAPATPPAPSPEVRPVTAAIPPLPANPAPAAKVENNQPAPSGFFMDISSFGQKADEPPQATTKPEPIKAAAPSPVSPAKPGIPEKKLGEAPTVAPQPALNQAPVPTQPKAPPPPVAAKPAQAPAQPANPKAPAPAPASAPKPQPAAADKPQAPALPQAQPPKQVLAQQPKPANPVPAAKVVNPVANDQVLENESFQSFNLDEMDKGEDIAFKPSDQGKATSPLDRLIEVAKKGKKPGSGGTKASHDRVPPPEEVARAAQASTSPQPSNIASGSIASSTVNNSVKAVPSGQTSSGGPQSQSRISYGEAEKTFENTALARAADPRLAAQAKVSFPNQASLQAKRNQGIPAQMPLQPLNQQEPLPQGISRQQIPQVSLDHFPIDPSLLQKMAQVEAQQVSDLVEAKRIAQKHKLVDSAKDGGEGEEGFKAFVSQKAQAILGRVQPKKSVEKPRVARAMATTRTRTTALRARGPSINIAVIILTVAVTLGGVGCYLTIMDQIKNKKPTATSGLTQGKKDYEEIRQTLEKQQDEGTLSKREQDELSNAYLQLGQKEFSDKHYSDAVTLLRKIPAKSPSYSQAVRLMRKMKRLRR